MESFDTVRDVTDRLSTVMLGTPYDRDSLAPERFLIDHLGELVEDYGLGIINRDELRAAFDKHNIIGFDIDQWIEEMESKGVYG